MKHFMKQTSLQLSTVTNSIRCYERNLLYAFHNFRYFILKLKFPFKLRINKDKKFLGVIDILSMIRRNAFAKT